VDLLGGSGSAGANRHDILVVSICDCRSVQEGCFSRDVPKRAGDGRDIAIAGDDTGARRGGNSRVSINCACSGLGLRGRSEQISRACR
jgi:hypothetical protein